MNVRFTQEQQVARPTPAALSSSVLDHATVVDNHEFGLRNNEGLWSSYNCLDTLVPTALCPDPLAEAPLYKTFSFAPWVPAFEFAVYGGVQCSIVGLDVADQQAELKRVFGRNEGRGVEMALLLNRFVANVQGSDDPENGAYWDAPVDLGQAPSLVAAIGIMEGYAAAHYAGVPTLHMPRAAITAAFGSGALTESGGKFYTKAGSKVAAGGGYDDGTLPIASVQDFYVTGEVYVERSEQVDVHQFTVPGDSSGTGSEENGLASNTSIALAERMYRVGIDCLLARVTATLWGGAGGGSGDGGGFGL